MSTEKKVRSLDEATDTSLFQLLDESEPCEANGSSRGRVAPIVQACGSFGRWTSECSLSSVGDESASTEQRRDKKRP